MSVDASDLSDYGVRLGRYQGIMADEANTTMQKSVDVIQSIIVPLTPVDTGRLSQSITTNVHGSLPNLQGEVMTPLIYGLAVEFGRTPGSRQPPTGPIELWLKRKGGDPNNAFIVARAIGRRGTKGAFMFKKGLEQAKPIVLGFWRSIGSRVFKRL